MDASPPFVAPSVDPGLFDSVEAVPEAGPRKVPSTVSPGAPPTLREAARSALLSHPETLHPTLWLGHQLGRHADPAVPSGFPELDAQLPGGGWPCRALSELLLPHPGLGEIRLLSLCLTAVQREGRLVMLFDPPAGLSAVALAQLGFDLDELLVVHTRARVIPGSDSLWAMEQALKSGHVGALVGWLPPRLRAERLRRLQLAAHAHDGPAFVMREMGAEQRPTSAPLRLGLQAGGADVLAVQVLKRRGPPLEQPIRLVLPAVLSSKAQVRAALPPNRPAGRRVDGDDRRRVDADNRRRVGSLASGAGGAPGVAIAVVAPAVVAPAVVAAPVAVAVV